MINDPSIEPLPDDVASVLAESDALSPMPAEVRARLIARVGRTMGVSIPTATSAPQLRAEASWLRAVLASRGLIAIVALATGAGAGAALHAQTTTRPAVMVRPTTAVLAMVRLPPQVVERTQPSREPMAATAPVSQAESLSPVQPTHGSTARPIAPANTTPQRPAATLASEQRAIETAHTALVRGRAQAAIETLQRHARQFPHGQLAEERDSMLVQALVADGRFDEAREQARTFRQRYPTSLLEPMVQQALRTIP